MKVAITGGDGFIGRYVQSRLNELHIEHFSFDRVFGHDVYNELQVEEILGDQRPDAVIHLAGALGTHELWDNPILAVETNIIGAINVGKWCSWADAKMVSIEQPHIWYNVYEASKLAARRMLTGLHYDKGLRIDFVTAHNAYGPGQHHGEGHPRKIIPTFATQAWNGGPIEIWGDGEQKVNLVYAGDVADALVRRALEPSCHPLANYQAGNDTLQTVWSVAEYVSNYVGGVPIEKIGNRPGEQSLFDYPEPGPTYPYRFDRTKLDATIESYRP